LIEIYLLDFTNVCPQENKMYYISWPEISDFKAVCYTLSPVLFSRAPPAVTEEAVGLALAIRAGWAALNSKPYYLTVSITWLNERNV
jgi:hypothetical protein